MTGMDKECNASLVMLIHAVHSRGAGLVSWLSWTLLVLSLAFAAILSAQSGNWVYGIGMGAAVPLMVLALLWWEILISSLMAQYQGYNRLVPGMRARCRRTLLLAACGFVCLLGVFICMAGALLYQAFLYLIILFSGICLLHVPGARIFIVALVVADIVLEFAIDDSMFAAVPDALLLSILAVVLAALAWTLSSRLFSPLAPDRVAAKNKLFQAIGSGAASLVRIVGAGGVRSSQALARDCRNGSAGELLLQGLTPWLRAQWLTAGAKLALLTLLIIALWPQSQADKLAILRIMVLLTVFTFQFAVAHAIPKVIYRSRHEQALLRLAARLPGAQALNHVLATALLRQLAWWWAGSTLIAAVLLYASGALPGDLLRMLPIFGLTLIPAGAALRDYSGRQLSQGLLAPLYFILGLGMMFMALLAFVNRRPPVFWLAVGAGVLLLVVASVWHGWRTMTRAPVALPAGRLG